MSELKTINAYQLTTNTEDSDVYIHNDEFGCGGVLVECYLKSEADKVISDLIEKNKRLARKDIIMASETIKDLFKEIHHQKFKRCLAMAKICEDEAEINHNSAYEASEYLTSYEDGFRRKAEHYERWQKRWLELAERFKEAK